ncbi:MAG TPA: hypothetical protein VNS52_13985, partial [Gemmatimonadaceae bacterium]|nr:hypothetical protein [Gemmatimonadaceae bacterium]
LLQGGTVLRARTLNLRTVEKINTALVILATAFVIVAATLWDTRWLAAAGFCIIPVAATNYDLLDFFAERRGVGFALAAFPLHLVYYLVSGTSAVLGWLLHELLGEAKPTPAVSAMSEVGARMWPPVPADPKATPRVVRAVDARDQR